MKTARTVTPDEVKTWKQALRRMTKLYRYVPADLQAGDPGFLEAVREVEGYFQKFQANFVDWLGNLTLPSMYLERDLEPLYEAGRQAESALNGLFPTYRDYSTGERLPSPMLLDRERLKNIRRYQTAFRDFFSALSGYLAAEGGSIERPPIVEQITVKGVPIHIINGDRERNERVLQVFLSNLPRLLDQVRKAGFGVVLRDLAITIVLDPTTIASGAYKSGRDDQVFLFPGGLGNSTTLTHELGHRYYAKYMNSAARRDWYETLKQEQAEGTQQVVSGYSRANPDEAFAEVFRFYITKGPRFVPERTRAFFHAVTRSGRSAAKVAARYLAERRR